MLDDLALMIDHSGELYDLLYEHRLGEANLLFRDSIREPYDRIEANGYSIGSGILRDIRRISRDAKKLN